MYQYFSSLYITKDCFLPVWVNSFKCMKIFHNLHKSSQRVFSRILVGDTSTSNVVATDPRPKLAFAFTISLFDYKNQDT